MDEPALEVAEQAPPAPAPRRGATTRLADQLKDRSGQLADFGLAKAAEFAEAKKAGVTDKLDAATGILHDLADTAGDRFGAPVGDAVHRGGKALDTVSRKLQEQSIEDLVGTARGAVVRYPAVALAAVSVVGFLAGRIVKAGLGQSSGRRSYRAGTTAEARA